jgi:hypothetical protein
MGFMPLSDSASHERRRGSSRHPLLTRALDGTFEINTSASLGRLSAPVLEFEGDKPREQSGGVELPDNSFEIAQAAGNGMEWHNIAITGRGQGHEAEID